MKRKTRQMKYRNTEILDGIDIESLPVIPVGYRLLIRQELAEEKSEGGILLGTGDDLKRRQKGQSMGTVVAIGGGCYDKGGDPWVELGDVVQIRPYGGAMTESAGFYKTDEESIHYHLINDEDVLGIIPGAKS